MGDVKECPSCSTPLGLFTPREANQHINECLDNALSAANENENQNQHANANVNKPPEDASIKCVLCNKCLQALTPAARQDHVNRCLDTAAETQRKISRTIPRQQKRQRHCLVPTRPSVPLDPPLKTFLEALGLGRYAERFAKEEIDLDALRLLSDHDLTQLKLPEPARRRIGDALRNVQYLRHISGKDNHNNNTSDENLESSRSQTQVLPESRLEGAKTLQENVSSDDDEFSGLYSQPIRTSPVKSDDKDSIVPTDLKNQLGDSNHHGHFHLSDHHGSQSRDTEDRFCSEQPPAFPFTDDRINDYAQSKDIDENYDHDADRQFALGSSHLNSSLSSYSSPSPPLVSPSTFSSPEILRCDNESPPSAGLASLSFGTAGSAYEGNNEKKVRFGKLEHHCDDCCCTRDDSDEEMDDKRYKESIERENQRHKRKLEEIETKYRKFKMRKPENKNHSQEPIDLTGDDDDVDAGKLSTPKQATTKRKKHVVASTGVSPATKKDRRTKSGVSCIAEDSSDSQGKNTPVQTQILWKATKTSRSRILADSDSEEDELPFSQRVAQNVSRKRGGTITGKDLNKLMGRDEEEEEGDKDDDEKISEDELFMDLTQPKGKVAVAEEEESEEILDLSQSTGPQPSRTPSVANNEEASGDEKESEEFMDLTQSEAAGDGKKKTKKKKKTSRLKKMKKCTHGDIRKAIRGDEALYEMILECKTVGMDHIMTIVKDELEAKDMRISQKTLEEFVAAEGISTRASAKGNNKAKSTQYFQELNISEMKSGNY